MKLGPLLAAPLLTAGLAAAQAETIDNTSYARNVERHLSASCTPRYDSRLDDDRRCLSEILNTAVTIVRDLRGYVRNSRDATSDSASDAIDLLNRNCLEPASRFGGTIMPVADYVRDVTNLLNRCSDSFDRAATALDITYQPRAQAALRDALSRFDPR